MMDSKVDLMNRNEQKEVALRVWVAMEAFAREKGLGDLATDLAPCWFWGAEEIDDSIYALGTAFSDAGLKFTPGGES
jgi:hypothetical protein